MYDHEFVATAKYYYCSSNILFQFTANGDYISGVNQSIIFSSTNRNHDLTVQILSDNFTEMYETFTAVLSSVFLADTADGAAIELTGQERARLIVNPDTATVIILDDDGMMVSAYE